MDQPYKFRDLVLAFGLTCVGAMLAWFLSGGLPLIGIDDAAITRSYAENVANGAGYVYNVGGEKVEGSTAFLWLSILTGAYSLTPNPELLIIALCGVFALGAVYVTLRLVRAFTHWLDVPAAPALWTICLFLMAAPGYFMWSVWTMMELALWSMMLIWLVYVLAKRVEDDFSAGNGVCLIEVELVKKYLNPVE